MNDLGQAKNLLGAEEITPLMPAIRQLEASFAHGSHYVGDRSFDPRKGSAAMEKGEGKGVRTEFKPSNRYSKLKRACEMN
ncbi:MAG: hypothetical protein ACRD3P_07050 [Terriglobales bacterium]